MNLSGADILRTIWLSTKQYLCFIFLQICGLRSGRRPDWTDTLFMFNGWYLTIDRIDNLTLFKFQNILVDEDQIKAPSQNKDSIIPWYCVTKPHDPKLLPHRELVLPAGIT